MMMMLTLLLALPQIEEHLQLVLIMKMQNPSLYQMTLVQLIWMKPLLVLNGTPVKL